jgi:GNAT superfamily N-acetyltransferase
MELDVPTVYRVRELPADIDELVDMSLRESFLGIQRLRADWRNGTNRFSSPGEALFEARFRQRLVGLCGLNRDPYVQDAKVGRVRHLYVEPDVRRRGIGRLLVARVVDHAEGNFHRLRLRTDRADADQFYVALGFERSLREEHVTHEIALRARSA